MQIVRCGNGTLCSSAKRELNHILKWLLEYHRITHEFENIFQKNNTRTPTLEHRYGACILDGGKQFSRSVPLSIGEDEKKDLQITTRSLSSHQGRDNSSEERGLVKKLGIKSRVEAVLATSRGIPLNIKSGKKRVAEGKLNPR